MKYLILLAIMSSSFSHAQGLAPSKPFPSEGSEVVPQAVKPEESSIEKVVEKARPVRETKVSSAQEPEALEISDSQSARENSTGTIMVGYQLATSWLPSKKTISYTHNFNGDWSLEGEYSFQKIDSPVIGIDVGEITERRFTLQGRRFIGNSFNVSFGSVYSTFKARVGNDVLGSGVSSELSAQNLGVTGGLGNRWQWDNGFTLGFDWIRVNIPVVETKVEDKVLDDIPGAEDRDDVKTFIRAFNRIPTFVLLGVNVGYSF